MTGNGQLTRGEFVTTLVVPEPPCCKKWQKKSKSSADGQEASTVSKLGQMREIKDIT